MKLKLIKSKSIPLWTYSTSLYHYI